MKKLNRRCCTWAAGVALVWAGLSPLARAADTKPNVLIIHTDEHSFRTLGCYRDTLPRGQAYPWGEQTVETPHIDWIAKNGALCTSFYATSPVCTPSRASFISGCYPQNVDAVSNDIPLNDDAPSFAAMLRQQGYRTGYAGKWHLDGEGKPQWAPARRFGFEDNRFMFNRGHWKKMVLEAGEPAVGATDKNGQPSYQVAGADATSFTTDWLADRAIDFIRKHRADPFCYMVSIPDPHGPNTVRQPYDTMFDPQRVEMPPTYHVRNGPNPPWGKKSAELKSDEDLGKIMAQYFGMVKCIDDNVGRMLKVLREEDLLDRTIVVFTADHGDLCGEHGLLNKGNPYEGSARIPFLIYHPARIQPGTVVEQSMATVDFLPTILSLMDVPVSGKVEGRNAAGLFTGAETSAWQDISFLRRGGGPETGWIAAVTSRHKLILNSSGEPWLLDLQEDPDELQNFYRNPAYRATVRSLARELIAYGRRHNDPRVATRKMADDLTRCVGDSAL